MDISTLRTRVLVGVFATVTIVGSGVATALVTSSDEPTLGAAVETSASTGGPVDTTTPSTPDATTGTTPPAPDDTDEHLDDTSGSEARYWGDECGDGEPTNHGQYVSGQPKGGESRSAAAQSDCGKPVAAVGEGAAGDDGDDAPEADLPDTDGAPASSGGNGNGNGNAFGRNK